MADLITKNADGKFLMRISELWTQQQLSGLEAWLHNKLIKDRGLTSYLTEDGKRFEPGIFLGNDERLTAAIVTFFANTVLHEAPVPDGYAYLPLNLQEGADILRWWEEQQADTTMHPDFKPAKDIEDAYLAMDSCAHAADIFHRRKINPAATAYFDAHATYRKEKEAKGFGT